MLYFVVYVFCVVRVNVLYFVVLCVCKCVVFYCVVCVVNLLYLLCCMYCKCVVCVVICKLFVVEIGNGTVRLID